MTSTQTEDGGLGPPVKGVNLVFLWVISIVFQSPGWFLRLFQRGLDFFVWDGEVGLREFCCCLCQSVCSLISNHRSSHILSHCWPWRVELMTPCLSTPPPFPSFPSPIPLFLEHSVYFCMTLGHTEKEMWHCQCCASVTFSYLCRVFLTVWQCQAGKQGVTVSVSYLCHVSLAWRYDKGPDRWRSCVWAGHPPAPPPAGRGHKTQTTTLRMDWPRSPLWAPPGENSHSQHCMLDRQQRIRWQQKDKNRWLTAEG